MLIKRTLLLISFILCFIPATQAYLDPGSGSYILQMIIAGVLGGFYAIKLYWNKIINFIRGGRNNDPDEELDHE